MLKLKSESKTAQERGGILLNRFFKQAVFYLLILLIVVAMIQFFNKPLEEVKELTYSEFIQLVENDQVASVRFVEKSNRKVEGRH